MKPVLCLDFDGVIHSYSSGWMGASVIPDVPVKDALQFVVLALERFDVHIFSSRSHQWGGKRAMKRWLRNHLISAAGDGFSDTPVWWRDRISKTAFADPWQDEVSYAADCVIREIKWPWFKPPATVTLDDRAITFNGSWPALADLRAFKPWNKA